MFGTVLECYELISVSLLLAWRASANKATIVLIEKYWAIFRNLRLLCSTCYFRGLLDTSIIISLELYNYLFIEFSVFAC